ncbi:MAG: DUF3553 domain-containing protein [Acidobacteriia bacterium]|nr:DUF3553 domain-containing protein [Terriglobia bacterium]
MEILVGSWVRHPKRPDWGVGEVLGKDADRVQVCFSVAGEKTIDTRFVQLEETQAPLGVEIDRLGHPIRPDIDPAEVKRLCDQFHEQLKDRRSTTDDGKMALRVLDDLEKKNCLSVSTMKQLFSWCHTGASYQEGVDLAQQICTALYGRVPTKTELRRKRLL